MHQRVVISIDLDAVRREMADRGLAVSNEELCESLTHFGFDRRADGLWECEEESLEVLRPLEFRRIGS